MENETRAWLADLADRWAGGRFERCELVGHASHRMRAYRVPDWFDWPFYAFDWAEYEGLDEYCPGYDGTSLTIDTQHGWEAAASRWFVDFLDEEPGAVIDVGAHVGWYSLLAATHGCDVLAVDGSPEHLHTLKANAARQCVGDRVVTCRGWVSDLTSEADVRDDLRVRVAKCDIEGMEDQFVRIIGPLLDEHRVDAVLMEVSPVFADHYPKTCARVADAGYDVFLVPLHEGEPFEQILREDLESFTATLHQRDYLFLLGGW